MSFHQPPHPPPASSNSGTTTTTGFVDMNNQQESLLQSTATTTATTTTIMTAPIQETTTIGTLGGSLVGNVSMEGLTDDSTNIHMEYHDMTEAERRMKEEELSFYSASENEHGDDNIWGLLSGVGGNIYEWYVLGRPFCFCQIVFVILKGARRERERKKKKKQRRGWRLHIDSRSREMHWYSLMRKHEGNFPTLFVSLFPFSFVSLPLLSPSECCFIRETCAVFLRFLSLLKPYLLLLPSLCRFLFYTLFLQVWFCSVWVISTRNRCRLLPQYVW